MGILMDSIPATEFKAKCLGILEEVHDSGHPIIVTKRGVPFAMVIPYEIPETPKPKLFGILKGTIQIQGDIIAPIDDPWDADK